MINLEELSRKLDTEIESQKAYEIAKKREEEEKRIADKVNKEASIGRSILYGIVGAIVGCIFGAVLGFIVEIGSCVSHGFSEKGANKYTGTIVIVCAIIGGILFALDGYSDHRKKR